MSTQHRVGFIGLGVMGSNLSLNLADNRVQVVGFDLDSNKAAALMARDAQERGEHAPRIECVPSLSALLDRLPVPRIVFVSVPAGDPVDTVCDQLIEAGIETDDIVVDTGNSLWTDSVDREQRYRDQLTFFTVAVSGGELGARFGPALMPSGSPAAWSHLAPLMEAIAARVESHSGRPLERTRPGETILSGEPCAAYIGPIGSGHYVKMVHNGIEYADMQLICETYHTLRNGLDFTPAEIAKIFREWNNGELNSYLIGISAEVLEHRDPDTDAPLVDLILDKAGQKGTGLWTAVSALELGSPASVIAQAVFSRSLSSRKPQRSTLAQMYPTPAHVRWTEETRSGAVANLRLALYCSKICAYAQGFELMQDAATAHGWQLDFASIARIWRAGCIIRAAFLHTIAGRFEHSSQLDNLLMAPLFAEQLNAYQTGWRQAVSMAITAGIPCPAMTAALGYFDSYRCAVLPATLLQGQRDYFGAHTFERIDRPAGEKYHVNWAEEGKPIKAV